VRQVKRKSQEINRLLISDRASAHRQREYRKRRRSGLRSIRITVGQYDLDALILMGHMKEKERDDREAIQMAVLSLLYEASDRVMEGRD
jgi:hypothetical protein